MIGYYLKSRFITLWLLAIKTNPDSESNIKTKFLFVLNFFA